MALGLAAPLLAAVANSAFAAPPASIPLDSARGQQANAQLPDFVIKCASVYTNPSFLRKKEAGGKGALVYELIAAVTVANIGRSAAHIEVKKDSSWGGTSNLLVVVNGDMTRDGGWVTTPTLAPGQSFTTQIGISYDIPGIKTPSTFTFSLFMDGNLKESNYDNDGYGPVTATERNTCGAPQYSLPGLASPRARRRK